MNIREIALKAGVSRSTVSRVINDVTTVDPKLARRVKAVIDEVGYRPNYQAQALARGRSHTVGLIVSEISGGNPFFAEIILYFERAAVEKGFEVLISFADIETDPEHVVACVNRMRERQVEGIAVLTFGMEESLEGKTDSVGLPMVFAGAELKTQAPNIEINYLAGMRDAVKHLMDFGHTRIGYLSGRQTWSSMRTRYDALRKAMKLNKLAFDKELVAECDHTLEGGAEGMAKLLSLPKPPTAVLCCNDMAAIGAMKTLHARGLEVAKDISLIGFDDLSVCAFVQPPLTSIRFSPRELATLAFDTLLHGIQGTGDKLPQQYRTHFVLRESTGSPRSGSTGTKKR
ncbi:MAG: LacI family DNA-binding transcriptional regulator [Acidobacteria bacterium]|nr:LacI family DNA-binding transcriptional regulator [Acidobacteriota bacterium]